VDIFKDSPVKEELTFEEICQMEPQIKHLYVSAKSHTLSGEPAYLWENFFVPSVDRLVGPKSINPRLTNAETHATVTKQISDAFWKKS
jgi:hypothetical protein